MKISYNWLLNYLRKEYSTKEIAECLTFTGLEVEGEEKFCSIPVTVQHLVVGKITKVWQHPDADKLQLTNVDTGNGERQIVCGAPNVAEGQKVIVALPGTVFYENGKEKLTIQSGKIRGQSSDGMICSEKELGISDDHSGIMELNTDKKPGTPVEEVLNIYQDTAFEIGLTPNRGDGASHIGCARDVAAARDEQTQYPSVEAFKEGDAEPAFTIKIDQNSECYRYAGLSMENAKVGPSPDWLRNYLDAIGVRPVNNVVDAATFVMMETGQPLHIFDKDLLAGDTITVEKMGQKGKFKTLDEKEFQLEGGELMIKDAEKPVAMAGIMGGWNSCVSEKTTSLFLESACFDPAIIRRASKKHLIFSDAAFRYERSVDPNLAIYALKRLALILQETSGAKVSDQIQDTYPSEVEPANVYFRYDYLNKLTGQEIPANEVQDVLKKLEFEIDSSDDDGLNLKVPTFRSDVHRPVDVAEEVLRIYSYDAIKFPERVSTVVEETGSEIRAEISERIARYLSSVGFGEIYTNSLIDKERIVDYENNEGLATVMNPLSRDLNVLRPSVLYTGLDAIKHNINRKNTDLKFFEAGKSFQKQGDKYLENDGWHLWVTGDISPESWYQSAHEADHFYIKGVFENILQLCGIEKERLTYRTFSGEKIARGQEVYFQDKMFASFGQVSPFLLKKWEIGQKAFYCRISAETLIEYLSTKTGKSYKPVNKFPYVRRDLSIKLHEEHAYEELTKVIREASADILTDISVFDVYEGEKLEAGYKSYAVKLIYESSERTLSEEEIDRNFHGAIDAIEQKLKANVRKS